MDHIIQDNTLSASEVGLLMWSQHVERFSFADAQERFPEFKADREKLLDFLAYAIASKGLMEAIDDYEYMFVGQRKKEKVLTAIESKFDAFRNTYKKVSGRTVPGLTKGLQLLKKHSDWRTAIDSMPLALEQERRYKEYRRSKNLFCEEWAMLETWISKRRWENEFDIPSQQESAWSDQRLLSEYMQELGGDKPKLLSQFEYSIWHSKIGPFMNIDRQMSPAVRRQKILHAHEAAQLTPQIVDKAGGLFQYLVAICKP